MTDTYRSFVYKPYYYYFEDKPYFESKYMVKNEESDKYESNNEPVRMITLKDGTQIETFRDGGSKSSGKTGSFGRSPGSGRGGSRHKPMSHGPQYNYRNRWGRRNFHNQYYGNYGWYNPLYYWHYPYFWPNYNNIYYDDANNDNDKYIIVQQPAESDKVMNKFPNFLTLSVYLIILLIFIYLVRHI
jgi:ABC-type antimicrobial peptide transport system permease subunit